MTTGPTTGHLGRRACLTLLAGLATETSRGVAAAADTDGREIAIVAQRYRYTPREVTARRGERIILAFEALDFVHGFHLPDFGLRMDLLPGRTTRIPLQPMAAGRFTFLCDNFCGEGHEEMNGTLVVTE